MKRVITPKTTVEETISFEDVDPTCYFIGVQDGNNKYIVVYLEYEGKSVLLDADLEQTRFNSEDHNSFTSFIQELIEDYKMDVFTFNSGPELMKWLYEGV